MKKGLIRERKYNRDGPFWGHVIRHIMQGMGKEVAYLRPIEWIELVLTGRYMAPRIKRMLDKWVTYPL